ncbi:sigma-B regulation protein RsbU (phosphoserine phosphatase) [Kribbella steppae]|uniref:Sigma-B regulation protein RsbU (Phosphoserine phosphatase) n=1 Tax=Kribbella steppae TaxID=2512223 RepID=A0A4R2H5S0_9ACTN|nr:SpoIIE family protein phosphatase [Kribbella steppae]TCO20378.1 sigma-B regulation protein RsbU (phosphoserine phosphatase) [Kribbella steppae]
MTDGIEWADTAEEAYDAAPSGHLSTSMDGMIVTINSTLLDWLGLPRDAVVGRLRFPDLLTVGGKLYHETHFAPLLRMQGEVGGVALELKRAGGARMPILVSSVVKYDDTGRPLLIRTTIFDAHIRRTYEEELLRERKVAEVARHQAEEDRARLQDALAVLQQSLLPATMPEVPGVATAATYHTASPDELGGDFYDLFAIDGEHWGFFLGDVCGKGPAAAAVTSVARYTLRAAAMHDPAAALGTLNALLHERYAGGDLRYCTAVFGTLQSDLETGRVAIRFASGGHPPPLLIRADGRCEFLSSPDGTLIGILPSSQFPQTDVTLDPGDMLLLYTDGLTEARVNGGRDFYGPDALRTLATQYAGTSPDALVTALSDVLAGFGPRLSDDTALLALGVPARPVS